MRVLSIVSMVGKVVTTIILIYGAYLSWELHAVSQFPSLTPAAVAYEQALSVELKVVGLNAILAVVLVCVLDWCELKRDEKEELSRCHVS